MEDDLKNTENGISMYQLWLWVLSGKFEENSEEISSVALLSPACYIFFFFLLGQNDFEYQK
jgi:hypothetical protein